MEDLQFGGVKMGEPVSHNTSAAPVHGNVLQAGRITAERIVLNLDGRGRAPVPRMLTRDPLHLGFHNRAAELAELDRLLSGARGRGVPLTVVLSGMPGVGKTTTMLRWAHAVQDGFPDGTLMADLGGTAPGGPATPFDLLGMLLRRLGVDDGALPPTEAERSGLLQTLLERRSVLVLLDDAATSRQVLPLLPSSSASCVLITTRNPLDLLDEDSGEHVRLEPFDEQEALELISRGMRPSPEDRVALGRLVKACGRLPLALRLAGARLRNRPSISSFAERVLTRRDLLGELHADGDRRVLALFDACYQDLPDEYARAYRALGLHPGLECSVQTAAVLLDVAEPDAEEALEELARGCLLEQAGHGRFRMHSLLHRHAVDKAQASEPPQQRAAVLRRMVEHYHEFAIARDHVLSKRWRLSEARYEQVPAADVDRLQALQDMDVEHANLLAAVRIAADLGMRERVWQLCEALFPYQFDRNLHVDLREVNELGITAVEELVDEGEPGAGAVLARMLAQHASGSFAAYEHTAAMAQFECARTVAVECGDARQEQSAVEWTGFLHERAGEFETALECFESSRSIILERFPQERRRRPLALYGMHAGRVLVALGRYDDAAQLLEPAAEVFRALEERSNLAKCDIPQAVSELHRGDVDSARQRAEGAMGSIVGLRVHAWRIDALELMASLHEHTGENETAAAELGEAAELAAVLGDPRADRLREAAQRSS